MIFRCIHKLTYGKPRMVPELRGHLSERHRLQSRHRLDRQPQWILPDLRSIRSAIAQGLGYSVLPDYLCQAGIATQQLTLLLQPEPPVTNNIWLAYRKSERHSQPVTTILELCARLCNNVGNS
jgi:DNA-binding transcriptional LysR family regulator